MALHSARQFSDHIVTTKLVLNLKSLASDEPSFRRNVVRHKVVRIRVTDVDATDSSSDEEGDEHAAVRRVKRHVRQIDIQFQVSAKKNGRRLRRLSKLENTRYTNKCKFRGVRQRPWGRWAAEIRDPNHRKRLWLGTYDAPEEAASVYDKAALRLKGPNAFTNFTDLVTNEPKSPAVDCPDPDLALSLSSPTSVLHSGFLTPFDGFSSGIAEAYTFGLDMELPFGLWGTLMSKKHFGDEEFGEFDLEAFAVETVS